ncbi:hypothetical protein F4778DRAFT_761463 [Xylariomycetidae sp. FL2044]|nr:hypothetical protein F4778DRAFT_761463 [Xylariomycetidae sp. FL2044]
MADEPISSWTTFQVAESQEPALLIFKPLLAAEPNFHDAFYGRISESPEQYILVVAWKSRQAYVAFTQSNKYQELVANLGSLSASEPTTQTIDFGRVGFWWRFGSNIEVRTVFFPGTVSAQTREDVSRMKGLVLTAGMGIDGRYAHLSPYRGVPTCGWVDGFETWQERDAAACVWCHYWKDKEAEENFKKTERRIPPDGESVGLLALEAFEKDLKNAGAVGWKSYHLDIKQIPSEI